LAIPDAVCTVLCSRWWAEEPPETCIVIYRNKQIKKTLHLVGCTLEIYFKHITSPYGQFNVTVYRRHKAHSTMPITWTKTVSNSNCAPLIYITCTRASGIVPSLTYCAFNDVCRIGTAHNTQQTVPQLLIIKCGSNTKWSNSIFLLYNEGVLFQFIIRNYELGLVVCMNFLS
jgi:hypothetical protein